MHSNENPVGLFFWSTLRHCVRRRVWLVILYFINAFTPITLDFFYFVILVIALSNGHECKCKTAKVRGDRHIKGAKVPGELSFPGAKRQGSERPKGPGNELAREREGQRAKVPGSESSRKRIGQGPIGRFSPGSELAQERKGSVPTGHRLV